MSVPRLDGHSEGAITQAVRTSLETTSKCLEKVGSDCNICPWIWRRTEALLSTQAHLPARCHCGAAPTAGKSGPKSHPFWLWLSPWSGPAPPLWLLGCSGSRHLHVPGCSFVEQSQTGCWRSDSLVAIWTGSYYFIGQFWKKSGTSDFDYGFLNILNGMELHFFCLLYELHKYKLFWQWFFFMFQEIITLKQYFRSEKGHK